MPIRLLLLRRYASAMLLRARYCCYARQAPLPAIDASCLCWRQPTRHCAGYALFFADGWLPRQMLVRLSYACYAIDSFCHITLCMIDSCRWLLQEIRLIDLRFECCRFDADEEVTCR